MPKNLLLLFIFFTVALHSFAQTDPLIDSLLNKKNPPRKTVRIDTAKKYIAVQKLKNSIAVLKPDSSNYTNDSTKNALADSLQNNVVQINSDSTRLNAVKHLTWKEDTSFTNLFKLDFNKNKLSYSLIEDARTPQSKDILFYTLALILLFLGFIKTFFSQYYNYIFRSFFQTTFGQKQNREIVLQDNLPSLLTNILFFLSVGLFIALAVEKDYEIPVPFLKVFLYCVSLLAIIYFGKFLVIRFLGWTFHVQNVAENYISLVFLINKFAGIIIIPLLLLFAFSENSFSEILITLIIAMFILLLFFRFIKALSLFKSRSRIHPFHFFLYLCIVEIIPTIVICKILFNKLKGIF